MKYAIRGLFARALEKFVRRKQNHDLLQQIDAAYDDAPDGPSAPSESGWSGCSGAC
ncbi:MAG: hypothetical protein ACRD96_18650 [Bryobacteraceae bacterium]